MDTTDKTEKTSIFNRPFEELLAESIKNYKFVKVPDNEFGIPDTVTDEQLEEIIERTSK